MSSTGLQQLLSLQSELSSLIDGYAQSESSERLFGLEDVGNDVCFEPQDPQLAKIYNTLNHMSAVVLGDRLPFQRAFEYHVITATHIVFDCHVEESLREAWDRGVKALSVEDLAKPTGVEPGKLARCLRLLAAHHIFIERETNVFARNRCSASFDSGRSVDELVADPLSKYASTQAALGAFVGHVVHEGMRSASYASDSLRCSKGPKDYGFSRAFDGDKIWEYFARRENLEHQKRFQCASGAMFKCLDREETSILRGFPWSELPQGSVVCDIAGRTGNVTLEIAQAVPHLDFVVQDQGSVIDKFAIPFWETAEAEPYKHRVKLIRHDFFDPQPIEGAAVYLIRMAIHGYDDEDVVKIFSRLSAVAKPSSRLLIIEPTYKSLADPGAYPPASTDPYLCDVQLLTVINVRDRLEEQYEKVALRAGWKLVKTWRTGSEQGTDGVYRHYEFALVQ